MQTAQVWFAVLALDGLPADTHDKALQAAATLGIELADADPEDDTGGWQIFLSPGLTKELEASEGHYLEHTVGNASMVLDGGDGPVDSWEY